MAGSRRRSPVEAPAGTELPAPEFALVPIERLKVHEEVDERAVHRLVEDLRVAGVVTDPVWVARDSWVILNGHHRYHALRLLGAKVVPAWIVPYDDPRIELDRWTPGPSITKAEVVTRARSGSPFPPKTTRHTVRLTLPARPTTLEELGVAPERAEPRGRS